jgi:arylsulfatase A-like enzyme
VTRRLRLTILLAIAWCVVDFTLSCADERSAGPEVPNIILIIGDDHGWPYFGFMGDEIVKTPNLDALAEEGVLFPHGYTTASICRPSLRSLLTGLHPLQWRVKRQVLRAKGRGGEGYQRIQDFVTLPRRLAERGYASFQGGKYWEGSYQAGGFTDGMAQSTDDATPGTWEWIRARAGADGLDLGRTTMQPLWDFLEAHRGEPFFVWFAPKLPHTPHDPPEKYLELYRDEDLSESARRYYANITRFDDKVGEIVARLEKLGLRDETLLVYLSDNGWEQDPRATNLVKQLGGPQGKSSMYDLGFRTPIIFSWPGKVAGGRRRGDLVSAVDLFTTLLDFAGLDPPPDRMGKSLRPTLLRDEPFSRKTVIGSMGSLRPPRHVEGAAPKAGEKLVRAERAYFLRNESWHYIWYANGDKFGDRDAEELYRIDEDPREEHNVVSQHPELSEGFREEIRRWREEVTERTKSATRSG